MPAAVHQVGRVAHLTPAPLPAEQLGRERAPHTCAAPRRQPGAWVGPGASRSMANTPLPALPPAGSGCSTGTTRAPRWIRNTGKMVVCKGSGVRHSAWWPRTCSSAFRMSDTGDTTAWLAPWWPRDVTPHHTWFPGSEVASRAGRAFIPSPPPSTSCATVPGRRNGCEDPLLAAGVRRRGQRGLGPPPAGSVRPHRPFPWRWNGSRFEPEHPNGHPRCSECVQGVAT